MQAPYSWSSSLLWLARAHLFRSQRSSFADLQILPNLEDEVEFI